MVHLYSKYHPVRQIYEKLELDNKHDSIMLDECNIKENCYLVWEKNIDIHFIYKTKVKNLKPTYKLKLVNVAALGCPVVPDV